MFDEVLSRFENNLRIKLKIRINRFLINRVRLVKQI